MTKITTKTWLAKIASIFTHGTSLVYRISLPGLFYSNTKTFMVLVSILLLVFWFLLSTCAFKWLFFLALWKEQRNNVTCTIEGGKSRKCCASNHTILFLYLRGTAQEFLFEKIHSAKIHWEKFTQRKKHFR